ncbi:MAG: bifunctional adenosylcobinamide kinase/adenosylcobinamide-phosphate guanylyltransferase, partial [Myxococcales bacterium]|nr:bifunctional adenosylcobinamide kinase/adenosylcobinamide-phosphate guanylyltransferase [Myxococcales bacterium]
MQRDPAHLGHVGHPRPRPARVVLVGGGVRSGKSSFAVEHALRLGERRAFVATATPSDAEMKARIERHQRDRRDAFTTVEAPTALA